MTKPATTKVLRKVPRASRRQQYSASTRRALIDVAAELFTEQGYAGTSLDEIVAGARVTKGALYHHFSGKQALFESVFEKVEADSAKRIRKVVRVNKDPWEKALAGLRIFLEVVQEPSYRRIVIQDGPAILGYERFREQEERSTFAIVRDIVSSVLSESTYDLDDSMVETFSRVFFGAMSAAGTTVSVAEDPKRASAEVETAIAFILTGLQSLAESGIQLPDPDDLVAEDEESGPDEEPEADEKSTA
ncbi:MAG: TetR/AcrR family transcriptional regulator [Pseudonocardia sp.]